MKILTIIGARPQFVKAAAVSREVRRYFREILVHTGQHYDYGMSEVFFNELEIPEPDFNLSVGSGTHGFQTGQMLIKIEEVMIAESPDMVMVYGDTNSTIAGALAAAKLHIPLAHVEAGLRSFNKAMPEEINRVLTDHAADLLFCPTTLAVENLARENVTRGVHLVGDVMLDVLLFKVSKAENESTILSRLEIAGKEYHLATVHRAENTDTRERLESIIRAFCESNRRIIFPLHPRTRGYIKEWGLDRLIETSDSVTLTEPVSYLDMLMLEKHARMILTDSGGVQKEAYMLGVPCITLREETEWVETVEQGANILVGAEKEKITGALETFSLPREPLPTLYGDGHAGAKIAHIIRDMSGAHH
jgi:UDP-N-acetylglucosamine 2-epimerase